MATLQAKVKRTAEKVKRGDGWANAITGFGDAYRDKRESDVFSADLFPQELCEELWRGEGLYARIIERLPKDMTRRGWEWTIPDDDDDADQVKALKSKAEELKVRSKVRAAINYQRAYGGGALLLGVTDGRSTERPLDLESVESFDWITELTPQELMPVQYYKDSLDPKYGQPEIFELRRMAARAGGAAVSARTVRIHETRLVIFQGIQVSKRQVSAHTGWGDPIFCRIYQAVRDFVAGNHAAALLLRDFSQAIYKIEGLAELIANNEDDAIRNRAILVDFMRSVARAILIDSKEDFERKSTPVTGMPELLQELQCYVSAITDYPVTVLFGRSPAGMNATGESDFRGWYDFCAGEQEDKLRDPLELLTRLMFLSADGPTNGKEPEDWSLEFRPLWQPTELERADLLVKVSTAHKNWTDAQILLPEEIAASTWGSGKFSMDVQLDQELRDEAKQQEEELAAQAAEAQAAALEEARAGVPARPGRPGAPPPGGAGPPRPRLPAKKPGKKKPPLAED